MLKVLEGLPAGVIGFELSGTIHAEDYRDVLLPALEAAKGDDGLRVVFVIPDFKGMTGSAVWEDVKVGFTHLRGWRRIALVTDIAWVAHLTSIFGWMTPGQTRVFALEERDEAVEWAAG
jgi:hypothetical protein